MHAAASLMIIGYTLMCVPSLANACQNMSLICEQFRALYLLVFYPVFEDSRLLRSILRVMIDVRTDGLTKEHCIAMYLFARSVVKLAGYYVQRFI